MIEGDNNTYDNLGIGFFHLSELKNGEKNNHKYFAVDKKKDVNYVTRVFTGKAKLISAFSTSKLTFLNFEAWFLEDFPDLVDYGEKKDKSANEDKIPIELDSFWNHKKKKNDFLAVHKRMVTSYFSKQSNYSYKDRVFFNLFKKDQYENNHLLPYYLSIISVPDKKFSKEEREKNRNFFDCNLRTLDEAAHYVRNYTFGAERNDVTVSPDFLLKTRKGDLDDHAILMACLMMGIKKETVGKKKKKEQLLDANDFTIPGPTKGAASTNTTTDGAKTTQDKEEKDVFPYENRVFVCMGKMKNLRVDHLWIMTIDDNYKDITFWDPRVSVKYQLKGRIKDPKLLKRFLNREIKNKRELENNEPVPIQEDEGDEDDEELLKKKKMNDIFDDRLPNGEGEDDINDYSLGQDSYEVFAHDINVVVKDYELINNEDDAIKMKKSEIEFFCF